jgi:hypothetical protein
MKVYGIGQAATDRVDNALQSETAIVEGAESGL